LGTEWKDHIWENLKIHRLRRNKNKEQEINVLITSAKYSTAYSLNFRQPATPMSSLSKSPLSTSTPEGAKPPTNKR
jgi:hypothetical protein